MCVVHAQSTTMATLILLFYLTVPKDAGIIHKLHSVELCILSFSCISVAHWYEINKWIDDHDKATVPTFKKRGTHSLRTQICSVSFIYLFSVSARTFMFFFFRTENYRSAAKVIIDNKVFHTIFHIHYRGKCCHCCGVLDMQSLNGTLK